MTFEGNPLKNMGLSTFNEENIFMSSVLQRVLVITNYLEIIRNILLKYDYIPCHINKLISPDNVAQKQ